MRGGAFDEADLALIKQLKAWEAQSKPPYELIVNALRLRVICQSKLHNQPARRELALKMLQIYRDHLPEDPLLPLQLTGVAEVFEDQKDPAKANNYREKADQFWQNHPPSGEDRDYFLKNKVKLCSNCIILKDLAGAKTWAGSANKQARAMHREDTPTGGYCLLSLASCEMQNHNYQQAIDLSRQALKVFEKAAIPMANLMPPALWPNASSRKEIR